MTTTWRYGPYTAGPDANVTQYVKALAPVADKNGRRISDTPDWLATAPAFTLGLRLTFASTSAITGTPAAYMRYILSGGAEQGLNLAVKSGQLQIKWPGAATSLFYSFTLSTAPLQLCVLYCWERTSQIATVSIGQLQADGSATPLTDNTGKSELTFPNTTALPG